MQAASVLHLWLYYTHLLMTLYLNLCIFILQEESKSRGQQTAVGLFRTPNMRAKTLNLMFNW